MLEEAIECCISIARQIVSELKFGKPKTYGEAFKLLADHGVIERRFSHELEKMVGFRNRITHRYWDVDLDDVFNIFNEHVGDFSKFEAAIVKFVEQLPDD